MIVVDSIGVVANLFKINKENVKEKGFYLLFRDFGIEHFLVFDEKVNALHSISNSNRNFEMWDVIEELFHRVLVGKLGVVSAAIFVVFVHPLRNNEKVVGYDPLSELNCKTLHNLVPNRIILSRIVGEDL